MGVGRFWFFIFLGGGGGEVGFFFCIFLYSLGGGGGGGGVLLSIGRLGREVHRLGEGEEASTVPPDWMQIMSERVKDVIHWALPKLNGLFSSMWISEMSRPLK